MGNNSRQRRPGQELIHGGEVYGIPSGAVAGPRVVLEGGGAEFRSGYPRPPPKHNATWSEKEGGVNMFLYDHPIDLEGGLDKVPISLSSPPQPSPGGLSPFAAPALGALQGQGALQMPLGLHWLQLPLLHPTSRRPNDRSPTDGHCPTFFLLSPLALPFPASYCP